MGNQQVIHKLLEQKYKSSLEFKKRGDFCFSFVRNDLEVVVMNGEEVIEALFEWKFPIADYTSRFVCHIEGVIHYADLNFATSKITLTEMTEEK